MSAADGGSRRRVAVVGDGSAHLASLQLATALAADVAAVERLGGVRAVAVPVPARAVAGSDALTARLRALPKDIAAVLITRTEVGRARAVQRRLELEGGRPVLTAEDTTAIALTASALAYLRRIGHQPAAARVLVAGATRLPILAPLLIGCGIYEVGMWNRTDERWFPLRRAVRDADVVLDLLHDSELARLAPDRPDGSILAAGRSRGPTIAAPGIAPGMLRALAEYPPGAVSIGMEQYCECALAVAAAVVNRSRRWQPRCDPDIARAVAAALHRSTGGYWRRERR